MEKRITSREIAELTISWFAENRRGEKIGRPEFFKKMKELGGNQAKTLRDEWIKPWFVGYSGPIIRHERRTGQTIICLEDTEAAQYEFYPVA